MDQTMDENSLVSSFSEISGSQPMHVFFMNPENPTEAPMLVQVLQVQDKGDASVNFISSTAATLSLVQTESVENSSTGAFPCEYVDRTTIPMDADVQLNFPQSEDPRNECDQMKWTKPRNGGRKRIHPAKPGKHMCPFCNKGCTKPSVLEKHIRAHTGERPYPCASCGISFKTKSNFFKHCKSKVHTMSHQGMLEEDTEDIDSEDGGILIDGNFKLHLCRCPYCKRTPMSSESDLSIRISTYGRYVLCRNPLLKPDMKTKTTACPQYGGNNIPLSDDILKAIGAIMNKASANAITDLSSPSTSLASMEQVPNILMSPLSTGTMSSMLYSPSSPFMFNTCQSAWNSHFKPQDDDEAMEADVAGVSGSAASLSGINLAESLWRSGDTIILDANMDYSTIAEAIALGESSIAATSSDFDLNLGNPIPKFDPTSVPVNVVKRAEYNVARTTTQIMSAEELEKRITHLIDVNQQIIDTPLHAPKRKMHRQYSENVGVHKAAEQPAVVNKASSLDLPAVEPFLYTTPTAQYLTNDIQQSSLDTPSTSSPPVIIEMVDPTQPLRRGRPKGARNVKVRRLSDTVDESNLNGAVKTDTIDPLEICIDNVSQDERPTTPSAFLQKSSPVNTPAMTKRATLKAKIRDKIYKRRSSETSHPPVVKRISFMRQQNICDSFDEVIIPKIVITPPFLTVANDQIKQFVQYMVNVMNDKSCIDLSLRTVAVVNEPSLSSVYSHSVFAPCQLALNDATDLQLVRSRNTLPAYLASYIPGAKHVSSKGITTICSTSTISIVNPVVTEPISTTAETTAEIRAVTSISFSCPVSGIMSFTSDMLNMAMPEEVKKPDVSAIQEDRVTIPHRLTGMKFYNRALNLLLAGKMAVLSNSLYVVQSCPTPICVAAIGQPSKVTEWCSVPPVDPLPFEFPDGIKHTGESFTRKSDKPGQVFSISPIPTQYASVMGVKECKVFNGLFNGTGIETTDLSNINACKANLKWLTTPSMSIPTLDLGKSNIPLMQHTRSFPAVIDPYRRIRKKPAAMLSGSGRTEESIAEESSPYVRGRGRGKFVCKACGIRCMKPSMLKKHLRSHTDLRPYKCVHCKFSFKTKGNWTKHIHSKTHIRICSDLKISPFISLDEDTRLFDYDAYSKQEGFAVCNDGNDDDSNDNADGGDDEGEVADADGDVENGSDTDGDVECVQEDELPMDNAMIMDEPKPKAPKPVPRMETLSRLAAIKGFAAAMRSFDLDPTGGIGSPPPSMTRMDKMIEQPTSSPKNSVHMEQSSSLLSLDTSCSTADLMSSTEYQPPLQVQVHNLLEGQLLTTSPSTVPSLVQGQDKMLVSTISSPTGSPTAKRHKLVRQKSVSHSCEDCGVSFNSKEQLIRHDRTEAHIAVIQKKLQATDPRPFKCDDCSAAFRMHGHLAKHLRSKLHITKLEILGKLPNGTYYALEKLDKSLSIDVTTAESALNNILRMIETKKIVVTTSIEVKNTKGASKSKSAGSVVTEEPTSVLPRSVACALCNQSFEDITGLKNHLLVHVDVRSNVCSICDAGFTTAAALKAHKKCHKQ